MDPDDVAGVVEVMAGGVRQRRADIVDWGPIRLDLPRRGAHVEGRAIELPPKGFAVLAELAVRPHQPISSAELARRVWPERGARPRR